MQTNLPPPDITAIVDEFAKILTAQKMSPWTVKIYAATARRLLAHQLTAATITSPSRLLQARAVIARLKLYELIPNEWDFHLPKKLKNRSDPAEYISKKYVSEEDFKRFLAALPKTHHGRKLHLLCRLVYYGGFRLHKVLALTPANFKPGNTLTVTFRGKGGKARKTVLPLKFKGEIKRFQRLTISYEYARDMTRRVMRRVGLRSSVHGLRHSFATNLAQHGVPVHVIQSLMGHSSLQTTSIYLHFVEGECPELTKLGY